MSHPKGKPSEQPVAPGPNRGALVRSISRNKVAAGAAIAGILVVALAALFVAGDAVWSGGGSEANPSLKAAIIDQLSLTVPNTEFTSAARGLLEEAGYEVDYYPGEQVTVNFYRDLPERGYDLILFRAHSGYDPSVGSAGLFTGEPYEAGKYPGQGVGFAAYNESAPPLFAIGVKFIESTMEGDFDDATIVLMGCDGLTTVATAEALIQKGAAAVVSWDGQVLASHTDRATENLLRHLLGDGLSMAEAVELTLAEVGPDPSYDSKLLLHQAGQ